MPLDTREAFRQTTVDEFLVAAGYFVGAAASNSTGNDETKQGEAGAAYLTAPAAASPAADAAIEEAFWSVFGDDVMEHLVWPAVRAGAITQPPRAQVDNPKWWTDGIAPSLEDERVYMLHWKGGRRSGRRCRQSANGRGVRRRRKHGFKNRHAGVARGVSSSQKQRT